MYILLIGSGVGPVGVAELLHPTRPAAMNDATRSM
jgi:hypothetical protein